MRIKSLDKGSEKTKKTKQIHTIDFFPVMIEGQNSRKNVVGKRHGLG